MGSSRTFYDTGKVTTQTRARLSVVGPYGISQVRQEGAVPERRDIIMGNDQVSSVSLATVAGPDSISDKNGKPKKTRAGGTSLQRDAGATLTTATKLHETSAASLELAKTPQCDENFFTFSTPSSIQQTSAASLELAKTPQCDENFCTFPTPSSIQQTSAASLEPAKRPQCDENFCEFSSPSSIQPETRQESELAVRMAATGTTKVNTSSAGKSSIFKVGEDSNHELVVFKASGCTACSEVICALKDAMIPYSTVDLTLEPWRRDEALKLTGSCTVPQIFLGGVHIGGRDDLKKIANGFDGEAIRRWYENFSGTEQNNLCGKRKIESSEIFGPGGALQKLKSIDFISKIIDGGKDGLHENPTVSLVEDIAMKGFTLRKRFGMGSVTVPTAAIVDLAKKEKWGSDDTIAVQVSQMAKAGVFALEGGNAGQGDGTSQLAPLCAFPNLDCINKIVDCRALEIKSRPADEIVPKLRLTTSMLYDKLLYAAGKGVNFENVQLYPKLWKTFLGLFAELQQVSHLERKAVCFRKAFFINLYNISHFASCAMVGSPNTSYERMRFFSLSVQLGSGIMFTLDDIEHGILRGVRFPSSDVRENLIVPFDPRIHFTLNCGAKSCPSISVYSGDSEEVLNEELRWATNAFCSENLSVDNNDVITASRLFSWYRNDFVLRDAFSPEGLLEWVLSYGGLDRKGELFCELDRIRTIAQGSQSKVKIRWADYEWERAEVKSSSDKQVAGNSEQSASLPFLAAGMVKSDLFFYFRRQKEKKFVKARRLAALKPDAEKEGALSNFEKADVDSADSNFAQDNERNSKKDGRRSGKSTTGDSPRSRRVRISRRDFFSGSPDKTN